MPSDRWHLDEMVVSIRGKRQWLWRAVDSEGEVPDLPAQSMRDKKSARRCMQKQLKNRGLAHRRSRSQARFPIDREERVIGGLTQGRPSDSGSLARPG
jgi:transposase-like protein